MAEKIVITSGKGGVGKTTVTAFLGKALAGIGKRVVLIDLDFGLNNLDVVLGLENLVVYDIQDVLEGRCRVKQALVQDKDKKNLFILSSGRAQNSPSISGQKIKLLLESINSLFDYVLLDCPAGIDLGFYRAVTCADSAIVVTTPTLSSLRDADKVISILNSYKLDSVKLIVNRVRGDLILNEKMMHPNDIKELLKVELLGILPEEDTMFLNNGNIPKSTDSFKAYKIIACNICNSTNRQFDALKKYSGFFGSIKRSLKKLWVKQKWSYLELQMSLEWIGKK